MNKDELLKQLHSLIEGAVNDLDKNRCWFVLGVISSYNDFEIINDKSFDELSDIVINHMLFIDRMEDIFGHLPSQD